jgi:hypothetical protein
VKILNRTKDCGRESKADKACGGGTVATNLTVLRREEDLEETWRQLASSTRLLCASVYIYTVRNNKTLSQTALSLSLLSLFSTTVQ